MELPYNEGDNALISYHMLKVPGLENSPSFWSYWLKESQRFLLPLNITGQ